MGAYYKLLQRVQFAAQILGFIVNFWYSYQLFTWIEHASPFPIASHRALITFTLLVGVWTTCLVIAHEFVPRIGGSIARIIVVYFYMSLAAILLYSGVGFFLHLNLLSRLMVLGYALTSFLWLCIVAFAITAGARWTKRSEHRVLIAPHTLSAQLGPLVEQIRKGGSDVLPLFTDATRIDELPFFQSLEQTAAGSATVGSIDAILIHPLLPQRMIQQCIGECQLRGITVELLVGEVFLEASKREVVEMPYGTAIRLLPYRNAPIAKGCKRATDLALSALALAVLAIPLLLIALLVKLTSKGPVLFVQKRVGMNGRVFRCLKFRTMVVNAEELKASLEHLNEMSGPVFKIRNDPRITAIGRTLRKYSLDELPQLLNVLLGDMSIVGPRPPLPDEVSAYEPWQRRRLAMRPGLTCLWQISGRNNVDFDRWMHLDLKYIDEWSYVRDWLIIAKTVPVVLFGEGAS